MSVTPDRAPAEARRIVGIYAGISAAWIVGSGVVLGTIAESAVPTMGIEIAKGLGFVAVTAALLYTLVRRAIAERDRLAALAEEGQRTVQAVIDAVPLAIVAIDPEQRVTAWNTDAAAMFALREEHRGGKLRSIRGGRLTPVADAIPSVLAPSHGAIEVVLTDTADQPQVILLRGSTVPDAGLILVAEPAQRRRGLEERMKQIQKVETVGRVASGVAHDFNNILTTILAHAEFTLSDDAVTGERREDAVEIRKAVLKASSLTRRMLAFSRHRPMEPVPIDVNSVLRELEELLRRVIGSRVSLHLELDDQIGMIRMDPGDLEQVILNLVVNAREAIAAGGHITVATGRFAVPDAPPEVVSISVRDDGEGMDTETLAHIFEPFFTTKLEGTGIGLATVYSVTLNAGGQVAVTSTPGQGATFTLRFPRHVAIAAPSARASGETARLPQILVVEDEAPVRMVIARVLERDGFRVIPAASAEEATQLLKAGGHVDLVLSDLTLPGEDGRRFLSNVPSLAPHAARILMSGHAALGDMELDGITFVGKPFAPIELLAVIRDCLARRAVTPHS